nr:IclR family transcriptional regulator C-terminal domain-containing protein [Paeniglutamicibacter terrestris]
MVEATGESAYLSVRGHQGTGSDHAVYLAIAEGTHSVRHASWVGRSVPLKGSSLGIVFAGKTPETGYVVSDKGVEVDVTAIAAPLRQLGAAVTAGDSAPLAAISVVAPSYRMNPAEIERIGQLVATEARALLGAGLQN